jgi:hypothetical protein
MAAAGALLGPVYDWVSAARPQATNKVVGPAGEIRIGDIPQPCFRSCARSDKSRTQPKSRISAGPRAAKLCGGLSKARQQPLDPFAQTSGLFGLTPLIST